MAVSTAFGQYIVRESAVHRLDARTKLILAAAFVLALFLCSSWLGLGALALALTSAYAAARIAPHLALRGMKPLVGILVLTVVFNAFTFFAGLEDGPAGGIPLIGSFGLNPAGAADGLFLASRMVLFLATSSLLAYTTPLVELIDALGCFLWPLKQFGFPVEDVTVVCALALRFVPTIIEEAERIAKAQRSRGLILDEGSIMKRAKAWIPVIIPLFVSLFKRAERLASALEARCYQGGNRTHLHATRLAKTDGAIGAAGGIVLLSLGMFC